MPWNISNRLFWISMVYTDISSNNMKPPFPKCYMLSGAWLFAVATSIDQTKQLIISLLPNWNLLPSMTILKKLREISIEYLQRLRHVKRGRFRLQIIGPIPFVNLKEFLFWDRIGNSFITFCIHIWWKSNNNWFEYEHHSVFLWFYFKIYILANNVTYIDICWIFFFHLYSRRSMSLILLQHVRSIRREFVRHNFGHPVDLLLQQSGWNQETKIRDGTLLKSICQHNRSLKFVIYITNTLLLT